MAKKQNAAIDRAQSNPADQVDLSQYPPGTRIERGYSHDGRPCAKIVIPAEPRPENIGDPRTLAEKKRAATRLGGRLQTAEQCARMVTATTEGGFEVRDHGTGALL